VNREIPYSFGIYAQGECLPRHDNYVKLDPHKTDAWGIPVLHINASYGENEHAMARVMHTQLSEILDAVKVKELQAPSEKLSLFGKNIHECGTARMGNDPKKSVVNRFNQVHDAKNVFVTDGACFVTQGCYEPTLTIMAVSVRAAENLAAEYKRGNL
jgi:choline dehydrogenase-like flavoprotein